MQLPRADLLRLDKAVRNRILKFCWSESSHILLLSKWQSHWRMNFKGLRGFRVGDYRVGVYIRKNRLLILVLFVDHRSTVYKRRALPSDFVRLADEESDAT